MAAISGRKSQCRTSGKEEELKVTKEAARFCCNPFFLLVVVFRNIWRTSVCKNEGQRGEHFLKSELYCFPSGIGWLRLSGGGATELVISPAHTFFVCYYFVCVAERNENFFFPLSLKTFFSFLLIRRAWVVTKLIFMKYELWQRKRRQQDVREGVKKECFNELPSALLCEFPF